MSDYKALNEVVSGPESQSLPRMTLDEAGANVARQEQTRLSMPDVLTQHSVREECTGNHG